MVKKYAYNKSYKEKEEAINEKTSSSNGSVDDIQYLTESEYLALPYGKENTIFYVNDGSDELKIYKGRSYTPIDSSDLLAWYKKPTNSDNYESRIVGADTFIKTWYDFSGNGNNLEQLTEVSQPKIIDQKIKFDGTDDYLSRSQLGLATTGDFTIGFTAKAIESSEGRFLISEANTASANTIFAIARNGEGAADNDNLSSYFRDDTLTIKLDQGNQGVAFDDTLKAITIVRSGDTIITNIDGNEISRSIISGGTFTVDNFTVGALIRTSVTDYFNGSIGEVVIIERALAGEELAGLQSYLS